MAVSKLAVYNDALLLIGERKLANITENRLPRRLLDSAFDLGAIDYCLEIVKPVFARKTIKLTSSVVSADHDLDNVFTLPSDWISTVDVYSDSRLDQPIARYINEDRTIACEFSTVFVRYISSDNSEAYAKWSPAFTRVVTSYLAREISLRLAPDEIENLDTLFDARVESGLNIESNKEPLERSKASTSTLSTTLRNIYNDALLIMGLTKIVANNDDSHRRSVLDTAMDSDLVAFLFEDIAWNWAITSVKILQNPSLETEWGWKFSFDKPSDMQRLDGLFFDEYFQRPLKTYLDEADTFFSDVDIIYVKYVSTKLIGNPDARTASFRKLVAGRLAQESYMELAPDKKNRVEAEFKKRNSSARSIDAMQSPPRLIAEGTWVRARNTGRTNRRRP